MKALQGVLVALPRVAGYALAVLLLLAPLLLVCLAGWPGSLLPEAAQVRLGPSGAIAGPFPETGLAHRVVRAMRWASWGALLGGAVLAALSGLGRPLTRARRRAVLAAAGALGLVLYLYLFLFPYPLARYYHLPGLGVIADRDPRVALATAVAVVALFLLFGVAYAVCRGPQDRLLWAILWLGVLLFAAANLSTAVTTTLDPYDYIARGRITGLYAGNPYRDVPADYRLDPFMSFVSWREKTSAYGPLWETVSGLLSRPAGNGLYPNLLLHKGLAALAYLGSVALLAATLRRFAPERALSGTLFFAWNPLVLMEAVGNAHNDILMAAFLLAAFAFLAGAVREEDEAGALLSIFWLGAAVLVKFVPLLLLPFFLLALGAGRPWRLRLMRSALFLLLLLLLGVAFYLPFWTWPGIADTFLRRVDMFRMTVVSVAKEALQYAIGEERAAAVTRWPAMGLFLLSYALLLVRHTLASQFEALPFPRWLPAGWREALEARLQGCRASWRTRPWEACARVGASAFFLYLLLGNFWFWPWYLIVPVALVSLAGDDRFPWPVLLACCGGELSHLAWNFLWYWWGITWDTTYQLDGLVVFAMVVPALAAYLVRAHRSRAAERVCDARRFLV